jgi:glycosyltransferase involved in cell wall biosynthesis
MHATLLPDWWCIIATFHDTRANEQGLDAPGSGVTVLHMLAPAPIGGLERVVRLLAVEQARAGQRVHVAAVVSPGEEDHPFAAAARADGVDVYMLIVGNRQYLREYREVQTLCARLRPHIVHTHGFRPDVVDGAAARAMGIATVSTVHGFTRNGGRARLYEWLQRRSLSRCDAVFAVSAPQVEEVVRAGTRPERVHLVPNAWGSTSSPLPREEARRLLGLPADEFVVGWVGRLGREKGPDVLVDACSWLEPEGVRASMVGSGRLEEELRARAERAGVSHMIRWHGSLPDAGALFAAFDVFALSSRTEGTPIALFEAMAAGVPVVATHVGGVPDVVSQGEARLVAAEDPEALAAAVLEIRADPAAARGRAARARARLAEAYDVRSWIDRHTGIYAAAIRKSWPAAGHISGQADLPSDRGMR